MEVSQGSAVRGDRANMIYSRSLISLRTNTAAGLVFAVAAPLHAQTWSYTEMLAAEFASTPLLDLRCALPDDQFMDAEHALISGAREVTTRVIHFVRAVHDDWQRDAEGRTAKPTSAAPVAARWSAGC